MGDEEVKWISGQWPLAIMGWTQQMARLNGIGSQILAQILVLT